MTAQIIRLPAHKRRPLPSKVRTQITRRLQEIGRILELPEWEIASAAADQDELVEFARKYGQSLDWIILGNPRVMIATLSRCR